MKQLHNLVKSNTESPTALLELDMYLLWRRKQDVASSGVMDGSSAGAPTVGELLVIHPVAASLLHTRRLANERRVLWTVLELSPVEQF